MRLSNAGTRFIAGWEGTVLHLYNDPYNATIGIGHLVHLGPIDGRASEAPYANGITQQQAEDLFRVDVVRFEASVNRLSVALTQNQFDALVSFSYNLGAGIFNAAPNLLVAIRRGDGAAVCQELRRYMHEATTGRVLDALVRRRQAECELFNREEDDMTFITWATLKDRPANIPFRSYLLFVNPNGLTKRLVPNAREHKALEAAGQRLIVMPLAALKAFAGGPEPDVV